MWQQNRGRHLQFAVAAKLAPGIGGEIEWSVGQLAVAHAMECTLQPRSTLDIEFRRDDLTGEATRRLVARHLHGMHENSPPESVHALDIDKLRDPQVTFWTAWVGGEIAGCGALKMLGGGEGEIKSMRVADAFQGQGLGRAMLEHILGVARAAGLSRLWLETGSAPAFAPALALYESAGFARCGPFGDYTADPFSVFMTREI